MRIRPSLFLPCLLAAALICGPVALPFQPADAQPLTARIEDLAAQAKAAYDAGDHQKAIDLYTEAWRLDPTPALLYNIGVIYERKLDDPVKAAEHFRRVADSVNAPPDLARKARARAARLEARRGGLHPTQPVGPGQPASPRATWGWVALGGGTALLIGGMSLGLYTNDIHSDFESETDPDEKRRLRDDGQGQALTADVLMGLGLVASGVGLWLLLGEKEPETSARVQVIPTTGGAAVGLSGVFW